MDLRKLCLFLLLSVSFTVNAQVPFSKGVNLTRWFQTDSPREIQFTLFTKQDFINIKSLGCDVIRLPINLHYMGDGAPDYKLDPLFFNFLDQVIDWSEELEIYLILDNHTFSSSNATEPEIEIPLLKVWAQMAARYKDRSEYLLYEVLNEPHGIDDLVWGQIQGKVIEAIRAVDTKHTIVVGGADFNSFENLKFIPDYNDQNLIYTFHFYYPFLFTHQGATWVSPSMEPINNVPYPYQSDRMPTLPESLNGTWLNNLFDNYPDEGKAEKIGEMIDQVVAFQQERNVPVYCGEMGVYIPNSQQQDRVRWYKQVREYLELKNIPWTSWDYTGGFGLFESSGFNLFNHDLNVDLLQALGMNVPEQTEYIQHPASEGFMIYSDFTGQGIIQSNSREQQVNLYDQRLPNNGEYCIHWSDAIRYQRIGFNFSPDQDLSELETKNYGLSLLVRGYSDDFSFDIRFVDTDLGESDHPWRNKVTLSSQQINWDGNWQKVFIPLSDFSEQGAWENGQWYNPEGKFNWQEVDLLEIITENQTLEGDIWFDNIYITDQDTARVLVSDRLTSLSNGIDRSKIVVFPNPASDQVLISYFQPHNQNLEIDLLSIGGNELTTIYRGRKNAGNYQLQYQLPSHLRSGIYLIRFRSAVYNEFVKIIKK